ncbi:MAG TPA: hemerythrin domain-containing protein [Woeseiaceae bacterium]|nr:hemerythrin domain-containing protein [Woeseiaceae bacterium]
MTTDEERLATLFSSDHDACNEKWARVEELLDGDDAVALQEAWEDFDRSTRRHLAMEEEVLFPEFEARSGMGHSGPTVVMLQEHEQMRALLDEIRFAIESGDTGEVYDLGDTLHMLTQQHNVKEEGMLYPMAEQVLAGEWAELRQRLAEY